MNLPLASVGPITPEAILFVVALLLGVAALTFAWLLLLLICSVIEAVTVTLALAVVWKRRASTHWFWRPFALSSLLGATSFGALALNALLIDAKTAADFWLPLAIAAPFTIACAAAMVVQVVRAVGRTKAALSESKHAGRGPRGALGVVARAAAARVLAFAGMALCSTGAFGATMVFVAALAAQGTSSDERAVMGAMALALLATGAVLAVIPWWFARAGSRLHPSGGVNAAAATVSAA